MAHEVDKYRPKNIFGLLNLRVNTQLLNSKNINSLITMRINKYFT